MFFIGYSGETDSLVIPAYLKYPVVVHVGEMCQ